MLPRSSFACFVALYYLARVIRCLKPEMREATAYRSHLQDNHCVFPESSVVNRALISFMLGLVFGLYAFDLFSQHDLLVHHSILASSIHS